MKVPVPESSQVCDKFIPVPDYVIPQTRSGDDSNSRTVKRKSCKILVGKFQHIKIPFIGPPKQTEIPLQEIPRKPMDFSMDTNTDFEDNSPYQEDVSETHQRLNRSYFPEPPELDSLISTSKPVQKFYLSRLT